ncbi:MAG TPA: iron-containing alcohol dehydrogenase [Firmicutes bacterium]|nr:iron-containing alcohol dehydrogenase [Bacillota bacterium]
MNNFTFQVPTKIIFGRGTQKQVGAEVKKHADKILLHYGGGSIRKSGLYDTVTASLREAGVDYLELGGVQPNPRLALVQEGIQLCRDNNIGFILAVGGGSVIDSAKAIAMGVPYHGDVWDFYDHKADPQEVLPVATVLTIPAAGSECSPSTVITNEKTGRKYGYTTELVRPVFSIMNPELCFTLPGNQVVNGISDMMAHIMERYFTDTEHVDLTDRLCEATLRSIIYHAPKLRENPSDYDAWAEIMWAGTIAHNDLLGTGRTEDWASHGIEHELSAMYDIAHGAGLSVIFPAWQKYVYHHNISRFVQFAVRVWDVDLAFGDPEAIVQEGIRRMERFFHFIGLPIRLSELGIDDTHLEEMAKLAEARGVGNFVKLGWQDVLEIYRLAL